MLHYQSVKLTVQDLNGGSLPMSLVISGKRNRQIAPYVRRGSLNQRDNVVIKRHASLGAIRPDAPQVDAADSMENGGYDEVGFRHDPGRRSTGTRPGTEPTDPPLPEIQSVSTGLMAQNLEYLRVATAKHLSRGIGWGYSSISSRHAAATSGRWWESVGRTLNPCSTALRGRNS